MAKLDIKIQLRKTLQPSTPTPDNLRSLGLSFFDQMQSRMYVPVLYYYLPSSEWKITEICDKLQTSLADTLTKFYPVAGRFIKDDLSIHCNDEGVEYVETKVDTYLAEFLHEGPEIDVLDDLLPWCVPPDTNLASSPLLGVQVNIFNCGGLVIGIQISHVLADAFTIATFLKEWAHISLTGTTEGCLPSFGHLSSLYPARVLPENQFSPLSFGGAKIVTRRFVFDAPAIAKLKDRIDLSATLTKPTRVVVVMSLIWKVLVGLSSAKHGHSRDSALIFPVNLRRDSILPSLQHALGNFCAAAIAILEGNQSREELTDFVNLVGNASRDTSEGIGKASNNDITSNFDSYSTLGQKDEMDIYVCTSWCKLPWYEADFGWGKPFWVSDLKKCAELVSLIDTKNGDGIEAWIGLKEDDMAQFEMDPDILAFTSKTAIDSSSSINGLHDVIFL